MGHVSPAPVANPSAIVQGDQWRFTVLTDGLIRLEWAEDGVFEDRASSFAVNRNLPVPPFDVARSRGRLSIATARFRLEYDLAPFSPHGLTVGLTGGRLRSPVAWRFGTPAPTLGGTARTLDEVDGRIDLGAGVVSRRGVAVVDDSTSFLFDGGAVVPRRAGVHDLYLFAYGFDYAEAIQALYAVSGPPPVLPRWALGNWWSRYHAYSADEYLEVFRRFEAEDLPFSVAVLDMDWHLVGSVDPAQGSGWTGFTWERALFPDPTAFLAALHARGLKVTLNLHPADGVRAFEDRYAAMARALAHDTSRGDPIPFDPTDTSFLTAYFHVLLHPLEEEGVDFWWIDWQQGPYSRLPGVDPLWLLNHYHFMDAGRDGRRPLILSRYAGPGSHRYPIGFSGDTVISWASLAFQPEFTATAANVGFGWWSHDIGGHFSGERDDELTLRWIQLGVFSPILRLHSSANLFVTREPWTLAPEARAHAGAALKFRHRLVPYLHTMNHRAASEGKPLVRPMYHLYPGDDAAYGVPNQFAFGTQMIVAPITGPHDPVTLMGSVRVWLPEGTWTDLFTGASYAGGGELTLHRDNSSIPVLLRAGAIVPLTGATDLDASQNPDHLELVVAPGADGAFTLMEDDGTGGLSAPIPVASTPIRWEQATGTLTIGAVAGAAGIVPRTRTWTVTLLACPGISAVSVDGRQEAASGHGGQTRITLADCPTSRPVRLVFGPGLTTRTVDVAGRLFDVLHRAHYDQEAKVDAAAVLAGPIDRTVQLARLQAQGIPAPLLSAITELLVAAQGPKAGI